MTRTWILAAVLALCAESVFAQERRAVVISGASAGPPYVETYKRWRADLAKALRDSHGITGDNLIALAESPGEGERVASRDVVRQTFVALRKKMGAEDVLLVVLIGHGAAEEAEAKFNLVGPDLSSIEWRDLIKDMPGRVVFVNTTAASFPFLAHLSKKGRTVITATDSVAQKYETVFAEHFIKALASPESDSDKNGRVSVWEAFDAASAAVRRHYEERGQLATERSLLDDNGDGTGKEGGQPGPDGTLARTTYLDAPDKGAADDPAVAALLRKKAQLEAQIEELKARKDSMPPADYDAQLEKLLLDLVRTTRQIPPKG